ncbi:SDR family oxidoreductase [uncultured Sanguibacteroides sp.]|uniref:SDR family oxidoreductase n=1 Tax=uncultured Sanguibacteroides sp. TaxID=1635151 RepID=UPI0025F52812|nr:SDR family oxidoreductase [uncultured Sanguibacteroides sp.]
MHILKIVVTGGAGFIGSNLCEYFLQQGYQVVCLDNLATGHMENMTEFIEHPAFTFIKGDIRDLETCRKAVEGADYVLHEAALGSVPRSIEDPLTTNEVNIGGFLNMLVAARDAGVKRFIYAASSSTYGDSKELPKVEEHIGRPLSPYAITKYVNELYADVFSKTYGMECVGLRYFNVFGKRQDPNGAYAAVIPLWVKQLLRGESPVINGDGSFSRDFTYIDNVIEANEKAMITPTELIRQRAKFYNLELSDDHAINLVFNVAFGGNTTLKALYKTLRDNLAFHDSRIATLEPVYGPERAGDIPHSQASILKAQRILEYAPKYDAAEGFRMACEWYWKNLK